MIDSGAGIAEKTVATPSTPEQGTEKNAPQELQAMQKFFTTITGNDGTSETKPSHDEVAKMFNLEWIRDNAAEKDVEDPDDGWYRERMDPLGATLRMHIQPEGLTPERGDMMLTYIDNRYKKEGEEAGSEIVQLESAIHDSDCRSIMLTFLPNSQYKFKVISQEGEVLIGASS